MRLVRMGSVLTATMIAASCGGRTEVLRPGLNDAGGSADAGTRDFGFPPIDGGGCNETVVAVPIELPELQPIWVGFKAFLDGGYIYFNDQAIGGSDQIFRVRVGAQELGLIDTSGPADLIDVRDGRVLYSPRTNATPLVGLWEDGQTQIFRPSAYISQLYQAQDERYVSAGRVAWRDSNAAMYVVDEATGQADVRAMAAIGPVVGERLMAWVEPSGPTAVFVEDVTSSDVWRFETPGTVHDLSVGGRYVSLIADTVPFVWDSQRPGAAPVPVTVSRGSQCLRTEAGPGGAAFLCSTDDRFTTELTVWTPNQTTTVPSPRGVLEFFSMHGRYLSFTRFPEGEDFCEGDSNGEVLVFDTRFQELHSVGTVRSQCGCCGRISAAPRTHIRDDVVLWHGEGGDTGFTFGVARMETRCE